MRQSTSTLSGLIWAKQQTYVLLRFALEEKAHGLYVFSHIASCQVSHRCGVSVSVCPSKPAVANVHQKLPDYITGTSVASCRPACNTTVELNCNRLILTSKHLLGYLARYPTAVFQVLVPLSISNPLCLYKQYAVLASVSQVGV